MEIPTEVLASVVTASITGIGGACAYVVMRLKRLERERSQSESRCFEANKELIARLVTVENRSHDEWRADLVTANGERAVMVRTLEKLADRIPGIVTPARGSPVLSSTNGKG